MTPKSPKHRQLSNAAKFENLPNEKKRKLSPRVKMIMRIHKKYFRRRSHTRLHSSSTSSFSSNSSSSSFSATSTNGNGNNESEKPVKGSNKTKKRPSWWKRQSFVSKKNETKQTHDKPPKRSNHSENEHFQNRQHKEPLVSSTELDKALDYFEIKEDLNPTLVKKKYKKLCLIHHPDRNGNNEESIQEMQTINHYFDILQEQLQTTNNDPSVTVTCSKSNNSNSKENRKHAKRRSSHNHRHAFVRRSKRGQKSDSRIHTKNTLGDVLLDVALSFLVGRFVVGTGWVASALMIGLAQLLQGGKYKSTTTTTTRLSKSLFFALHTGWFLLLECLATSQTLIGELSWQLKLLGLATFCSSFLEDHKDTPLKCLTTAILETESSLIGIGDWILSNNIRFKNSNSIPIQTIADFGVLSIAFLFGKLIYSALS